jgi:hypothetical protein
LKEIKLHRYDLKLIIEFANKYPKSEYITISANDSSGIGSIVSASLKTVMHGDEVTITKSIVDVDSW